MKWISIPIVLWKKKSLHLLIDINECLGDHPCQQECVNLEGSYKCACLDGWSLDGLPDDNPTNCVREYYPYRMFTLLTYQWLLFTSQKCERIFCFVVKDVNTPLAIQRWECTICRKRYDTPLIPKGENAPFAERSWKYLWPCRGGNIPLVMKGEKHLWSKPFQLLYTFDRGCRNLFRWWPDPTS